jgi:succinoglycan biosynthesis transport protein ExoP
LVQILVENELNRAGALSRRQVLDKLLHDRHKNLDELTMKELQMEPLQRKASALQTAMSNLLAKEAIAKLSSLIDLSNATVIERAALPPEPDQIKNFRWFPKRKLLLLLSFLLSLLVGLSIIFLQEYLDDSFSDAQEIQAFVNVPVLGSLPELPPLEPFTMEAVMAHPPWSQAVLTLSYLLKPLRTEESPGLVAITSAVASEGKSLLTASLGQILASRGLKVMMVDLNFSHPSLASLWKAVSGPSLYEVLQGRSDLSQTGYRVGSNELYLLPGSRTEESLGTLVDLPALKNLMGLLKNSYDAVLLDLPAIGVGEGAPLTALGDQVLMVVAANRTSRELVSCAVEQIKNFQERLEGLILNGVKNIEPWSKWAQPFFYQLKSISQYLQGKLKR